MAKKQDLVMKNGLIDLNWTKYRRFHGLDEDQLYVYDESSFSKFGSDKEEIQKNPTLFIPSLEIEGVQHLIFETVDNHLDEITAKGTCGDTLNFIYDIGLHEFTTSDNGRGIPHGMLVEATTVISAGAKRGNSKNTAYQESGGLNGYGYKLNAYLCEFLNVTTRRENLESRIKFFKGDTIEHVEKEKTKLKSGTINHFKFSKKYFPTFKEIDTNYLKKILEQKAFINPGIKINFIIMKNGHEIEHHKFHGRDIYDWAEAQKPTTSILRFKGSTIHPKLRKEGKVDFIFAYREDLVDQPDEKLEFSISYANGIRTVLGGKHLDGARAGLVKFFRKYMMEKSFNKKEKESLNIIASDIFNGLVCCIDVRLNEPVFRAQHKDRLEAAWVGEVVENFVYKSLMEAKEKDLNNIANFIKGVIKARNESKKIRTAKNVGNAFSPDRIAKYISLISSVKTRWPELHLVEGDSASGNIQKILDPFNQAVYQLTGKPDNYVDQTPADIMAEGKGRGAIRDIYNILGIYPGKRCDPATLPFRKIIFDMDADTDGEDMMISVLSTFAVFNPELVEAGMIYRSVIPLYSFTDMGKTVYLPTQKHLIKYILNKFINNHSVYLKKKEFNNEDLFNFVYQNYKYQSVVTNIADALMLDPVVAEAVAAVFNDNSDDLEFWKAWAEKNLDSNVRVTLDKKKVLFNGIQGASGLYLIFDKNTIKKLKKIKRYHDYPVYGYQLDENKTNLSLYQIMTAVHKYEPKHIDRYKGVGEFESEDLAINCFNPQTRVIKQVVFSDKPDEDMEMIYLFKSGKKKYVEKRSLYLQNVDASDIEIDT